MRNDMHAELNLVPYLDIMVNLILFMIVATAYVSELRAAPVEAPGGVGDGAERVVTVAIHADGFGVGVDGIDATLARDAGGYPYAALATELRRLQSDGDVQPTLQLVADPAIPYKVLVATLDAARSDAAGPLFPGIVLAVPRR